MLKIGLLITIAGIYGLNLLTIRDIPANAAGPDEQPSGKPIKISTAAFFQEQFVNQSEDVPRVHAPTAIINAEGELHSYWYGGASEGATDVAIYGARFDPMTNVWTDHHKITSAASATAQTGYWVRKIGNPVAFAHPDESVWLFYINVTIGGWALSAINLAISTDGGRSFSGDKRLVTSPFFNRSTLVKTPAFELANGLTGLPVHHQMMAKHGELLTLDSRGDVIDKRRIPSTLSALQPAMVSLPDGTLVALMRSDAGKILRSSSENRGASWSQAIQVDVPNPDSAVAVVSTPTGLLLAFNNDPKDRDTLSLAHSDDGGNNWREFHVLENQPNLHEHDHSNEFSYPWFVKDNGTYHLFYTWQRTSIKHVRFNEAWLIEQLRGEG
ncbi:MAG: exo-alpha-sialidase [Gammaproteobacteria bacterium]|nr:exo-alpha-sialidase [Gammaproteobacteria bacterium]